MGSPIELATERLVVRDHLESDLPVLAGLLTRPDDMYYLPELFAPDLDAARRNLEEALRERDSPERRKYFFALVDRASGEYVGEMGFTLEDESPSGSRVSNRYLADLGYFIKHEFWGKGIATEAGRKVIEFGFARAGVWKFKTGCLAENAPSERVMVKLGFRKEGKLRRHQWHEGEWKDRLVYGLLREDLGAAGYPS